MSDQHDPEGGPDETGRPRRFYGDPNGDHHSERGEVRDLSDEELAGLHQTAESGGGSMLAPRAVREQDARDFPHDDPCPRCGRRAWSPTNPVLCRGCGAVFTDDE